MSFATELTAALLHADAAYRADLDTAFTNLESALNTEWVTDAGNSATDATFIQIQSDIIDMAENVASQFTDQ